MRRSILVAFAVVGVVVLHGIGDAGAAHAHADVEMAMNDGHSPPDPGHLTSHVAAMGICAFAVVYAAQRVRRTTPPLRTATAVTRWPSGRLLVGPEPPVPRSVV